MTIACASRRSPARSDSPSLTSVSLHYEKKGNDFRLTALLSRFTKLKALVAVGQRAFPAVTKAITERRYRDLESVTLKDAGTYTVTPKRMKDFAEAL